MALAVSSVPRQPNCKEAYSGTLRLFANFQTHCVLTVGEAFMPVGYAVRFRLTFRKIETFYRREA